MKEVETEQGQRHLHSHDGECEHMGNYNNNNHHTVEDTAVTNGRKEDTKDKHSSITPTAIRKHVWLPARSMLILTGDARYKWAHGIMPRKRDKV